jgi:hypothetical protein
MPLHCPKYTEEEYEDMPESKLDYLLAVTWTTRKSVQWEQIIKSMAETHRLRFTSMMTHLSAVFYVDLSEFKLVNRTTKNN